MSQHLTETLCFAQDLARPTHAANVYIFQQVDPNCHFQHTEHTTKLDLLRSALGGGLANNFLDNIFLCRGCGCASNRHHSIRQRDDRLAVSDGIVELLTKRSGANMLDQIIIVLHCHDHMPHREPPHRRGATI